MANPILEFVGVSKKYGGNFALEDVSFDVRPGEIHAILGENGAGKSTLVKIVSGQVQPSAGTLMFKGTRVTVHTPARSRQMGVAMVQQELSVFDHLSIAENVFPDHRFAGSAGLINWNLLYRAAQGACEAAGFSADVRAPASALSPGRKQLVEILRCVHSNPSVLVLDEPTSGLNTHETAMLVSLLLSLRDRGVTVLYISHRIPEVLALSNRITILRDGRKRATVENDGLTESSLVQMMVGRDLVSLYDPTATKQNGSGAASLAVEGLSGYGSVHDVDLTLGEGEILGVFGLEGSGSFELAETIVGLRRRRSGRLRVGTTVLRRWQPRKLLSLGVQYLHNNRKDAGLYLALDVSENAEAPRLKRLSSHGLLNRRKLSEVVRSSIQRFEIKARPRHQRVVNLSGGNQQKLMMSLCLDGVPKCFVVCEPTRGVDVGSKAQIHGFLRNVAAEGGSIMMFSSELPEIIALCTRVLIMRAGGVVGQLVGNDITEENVMARAAGASD